VFQIDKSEYEFLIPLFGKHRSDRGNSVNDDDNINIFDLPQRIQQKYIAITVSSLEQMITEQERIAYALFPKFKCVANVFNACHNKESCCLLCNLMEDCPSWEIVVSDTAHLYICHHLYDESASIAKIYKECFNARRCDLEFHETNKKQIVLQRHSPCPPDG